MPSKKTRRAKKPCRPNPHAEARPRFELISLIADCSPAPDEGMKGVHLRFAVRDSQTGTIHRNLSGGVVEGPSLGFVQLRGNMTRPSLEFADSEIISPGHSITNFSTEECRSILAQVLCRLIKVTELFDLFVPPLAVIHKNGQLAFFEYEFTSPGKTCDFRPERAGILRELAPLPEELDKQSGLSE